MFTYNVNSQNPTDEVKESMNNALGLNGFNPAALPDIYAFGFQEAPESHVPRKNKDKWSDYFDELLEKYGYVEVGEIKMHQIKLFVYAKKNIASKITDTETSKYKTGFSGLYGNKGGVALRMTYNGSTICFLSCHLAAFDEKLDQRISDYKDIVYKIHFKNKNTPDVLSHDHVLLMGDLNMRINDLSPDQVLENIKKGSDESRNVLLAKDQLNQVRNTTQAFHEFEEQYPRFWPTYKFNVGTNVYATDKRKPAFCDRILHKKVDKSLISQTEYRSYPEFRISDHIPVSTIFTLRFVSVNQRRHGRRG